MLLCKLKDLTTKYEGGRPKIENLLTENQRVHSAGTDQAQSPTSSILDIQVMYTTYIHATLRILAI